MRLWKTTRTLCVTLTTLLALTTLPTLPTFAMHGNGGQTLTATVPGAKLERPITGQPPLNVPLFLRVSDPARFAATGFERVLPNERFQVVFTSSSELTLTRVSDGDSRTFRVSDTHRLTPKRRTPNKAG